MIIRKADEDDIAGIARVHVDTWQKTYKGIISDDFLRNLTYKSIEEHLKGIYQVGDKTCLIAQEESGKIVGFAAFGLERTNKPEYKGELYAIYILKEYQRKGIGKQLIQAVVRELKDMEISSLLVWVVENNPSKYFYEKLVLRNT